MYTIEQIKNTVFQNDALMELKNFPDNCIDLVVTSPPYYNLRNYQHHKQIGNEFTPQDYIRNLINIFREVKRVLKKTGSVWVNISDTYASGGGMGNDQGFIRNKGKEILNKPELVDTSHKSKLRSIMGKSLLGIPEMFVLAMQYELGFIRRNTVIWHKPSCMPSSVKDRFTIDFEYFYMFVKNNKPCLWKNTVTNQWTKIKPNWINGIQGIDWDWFESNKKRYKRSLWDSYDYYFETQFEPMKTESLLRYTRAVSDKQKFTNSDYKQGLHIPKPNITKEIFVEYKGKPLKDYKNNNVQDPSDIKKRIIESWNKRIKFGGNKYPNNQDSVTNSTYSGNTWQPNLEGRIKRCVWSINTNNSIDHHFATYPDQLIETPIKACSNTKEYNLVLDPFAGSGTTLLKSRKMGRLFVGIEINPDYCKIINKKLNGILEAYF